MRKEVIFSAVLWLLVMGFSFKGCNTVAPASTPSAIVEDGTIHHPYIIDGPPGAYLEVWNVTSQAGQEQWLVNPVYIVEVKRAMYVMHGTTEYQISGIDQPHHRLSVVMLGN